jgi:copper chaperone CopZ
MKINKIIKAIQKINPNAEVSVSEDDINSIVWENGTAPIPVADIQAQIPIVEQEIAQEETDKETKKASAKQKLLDLGLTEEEIKLTFGI